MKDALKRTVRVLVAFVLPAAVVLAFVATLLASLSANATEPGALAAMREEAMRMRESAFRSISLPREVVAQFLRETNKPGIRTLLVAGDHFESMIRKSIVYHDIVVGPSDVPMTAEKWEVYWGRRVFSAFLVYPTEGPFYWSFKIRTTSSIMACLPFGVEHITSTVARAT
jgi:hypothetical protein